MKYVVGTEFFKNKFLATDHALRTNQDIHFDLYDQAFDQADWMHEPVLSWDQLLDIRAQQIRDKNKPIVLNFSGGTDSYTIYKVFERNNIHIDLLYWRRRNTDFHDKLHSQVIELLKNGIYDPHTKIIIRTDTPDTFARAYDHADWLWNSQARHEFGLGFNGDYVTDGYLAEQLGTDDFISVIGLEKPRLYINHTGAYSYQNDPIFQRVIENPFKTDCFYISPDLPELHIKQSYLLLKHIKKIRPGAKPKDLTDLANNIQYPDKFDWNEYALACGRFGDLTNSGIIHNGWNNMRMKLPTNGKFVGSEHKGFGQNWYSSLVGTKIFDNYTQGIMRMANDPVGKFLYTDPDNFYNIKQFRSKMHKLDFTVV